MPDPLDRGGEMDSPRHHRWNEIPAEEMNPLFTRQYIIGVNTMLARVTLKEGALVPEHHHIHEQICQVVEGSLRFRYQGRETVVSAGEVMCLPPSVPHEVTALEDSVALEVFNPPRHDWLAGDDAYLRGGSTAGAKKS